MPGWVTVVAVAAGGPILLLLLLAGGVVGAKAWRRSRRRRAERPSARVAGAWRELVDHARDLGHRVPPVGMTRREQAGLVGATLDRAPVLARTADGHVFGPMPPGDAEAAAYWNDVDAARRELSGGVGRRRRMWAAVSPVTLRPTPRRAGAHHD